MKTSYYQLLIISAVLLLATPLMAQFPVPTPPPGYSTDPILTTNKAKKRRGEYIFELSEKFTQRLETRLVHRFGVLSEGLFKNKIGRKFGIRNPTRIEGTNKWAGRGARGRKKLRFLKAQRRQKISQADVNYKITAFNTNDFFMQFGLLWGLDNKGFLGLAPNSSDIDIDAPEAWEISQGDPNLVVAIIDTGIWFDHPELKDNIFVNPNEEINGVDDDGNGFIDDISGWDFHNDDNDPSDDHYHGTHVAGTIAGIGNNGRGVIGVAPNVKILPIKVIGGNGEGSTEAMIRGIEYVIGLKQRGINVAVINASLGGGGRQEASEQALSKANREGITFVAAAGNSTSDNDSEPVYPAGYELPNVISVASINSKGELSSFSNFGKNTVDVAAPGENIWSTIVYNFYLPSSGTSMAAPHVAGIAALLHSQKSAWTPERVIRRITSTVKPIEGLNGKLAYPGIVSAYNVLN